MVVPAQRAVTGVGSRRINAVTMTLIGINIAVFIAELAAGGTTSGTGNWIFSHGALLLNGVTQGGKCVSASRPLSRTSHARRRRARRVVADGDGRVPALRDPPSRRSTCTRSSIAGTLLEQLIGRWRFALLYLASGIAGSAGAILWNPNQVSVGASGAIFGILGGLFVLERRGNISTGGQIAGLIVLNLIITFALSSYISVGSARRRPARRHPADGAAAPVPALGGHERRRGPGGGRGQRRDRVLEDPRLPVAARPRAQTSPAILVSSDLMLTPVSDSAAIATTRDQRDDEGVLDERLPLAPRREPAVDRRERAALADRSTWNIPFSRRLDTQREPRERPPHHAIGVFYNGFRLTPARTRSHRPAQARRAPLRS